MNAIELLMNKLKRLTREEACWLLELHGHKDDEIAVRMEGRLYWTTPYEIAVGDGQVAAITTEVRFLGGPRGVRYYQKYYWGSLVSLVVDRILLAYQERKIGFIWLLGFNDQTTQSIEKQLWDRIPDAFYQRTFFDDERAGHYEPVTMNDRETDDIPFDNPVVDYVQIGDDIYPIHEDGRQGCVVQRAVRAAPNATNADDGTVYLWSSSGRTNVSV
jgi:hypothetical protein